MRAFPRLLAVSLALVAAAVARSEDPIPKPDVDRVDHRQPSAHLAIPPSVGDVARVQALGKQLLRDDPRDTLASIGRWIRRNLRSDPKAAYAWRPFETIVKDGTIGSCADHAVMFGALARACGIPTVWVKTLDEDWIAAFRRGEPAARETWRGHVFLEVHLDGAWRLLDAEAGRLFERYDPASRHLPGGRLAYDKGGDPYALVLSCRWEEWKKQTEAFVNGLDLATLPWSEVRHLYRAFTVHLVSATEEATPWVKEAVSALRLDMGMVIGQNFETWMREARGATVVVLAKAGQPALPAAFHAAWLPAEAAAFLAAKGGEKDWLDRRLDDGTRVVLVRAEDQPGIQRALMQALR